MNGELLPCPFCGEHSTVVLTEHTPCWFYVKCDVCDNKWADETRELVIAQWNQRPIENALRNRIAELDAQLVLVSRELASTDNADRYYRGFNDGYDHAKAQEGE